MNRKLLSIFILTTLLIITAFSGTARASDTYGYGGCSQLGRLSVGSTGRVTYYPNLPNRIRSYPSFYGNSLGLIPVGGTFYILGGPQCDSGLLWWQVNYNGTIGWTAEGDGYSTYWLEPYGYSPPPPPPPTQNPVCALQPRLTVGGVGRVLPNPPIPNVVRTAPGTTSTGSNSQVIGEIQPGGVFSVLAGPNCGSDGRWWWQVNHNGLVGWTAEGEGYNRYWVEPWYYNSISCPGFLPSRLTPGARGAVTSIPNLPNRVRTNPAFNADTQGLIPVNGVFDILSGPYCNDNTAWWQVSYYGLVGWTAEGQGGTYWLQPA